MELLGFKPFVVVPAPIENKVAPVDDKTKVKTEKTKPVIKSKTVKH